MNRARAIAGGVLWFAIILAIALGASGLVSAMDQRSRDPELAELTAAGDAEVTAALDSAEADLLTLADQVDALSLEARTALAALNGVDPDAANAAIARGDDLVADVVARTARLRDRLATVPYLDRPDVGLILSPPVVARHAALLGALDATDGLDTAWARLTIGAVAAARMSTILAEHDRIVGRAADRGVHARYADALELLVQARAQIDAARAGRDKLVATVDVSVLDEWLKRNEAYDIALTDLYRAISKVGSRVTAETRRAVAAEAKARANLPPDTRGLVIIMGEIGRGGMNGAVIAIEQARANLADAVQAGTAPVDAEPEPSPSR